jgi:hypothetical protein
VQNTNTRDASKRGKELTYNLTHFGGCGWVLEDGKWDRRIEGIKKKMMIWTREKGRRGEG